MIEWIFGVFLLAVIVVFWPRPRIKNHEQGLTMHCICDRVIMEAGPGVSVETKFKLTCRACQRDTWVIPFETPGEGGVLTIKAKIEGFLRLRRGGLPIEQ